MPLVLPVHFAVLDSSEPHMRRPWGDSGPSLADFCGSVKEAARDFPDPATAAAKYVKLELETLYVFLGTDSAGPTVSNVVPVHSAEAYKQQSDAWQLIGMIIDLTTEEVQEGALSELADFICFALQDKSLSPFPPEFANVAQVIPFRIWVILNAETSRQALTPKFKGFRSKIRSCGKKAIGYEPLVEPSFDHRTIGVQIGLYLSDIEFAELNRAGR